jgi:hypothetical protein
MNARDSRRHAFGEFRIARDHDVTVGGVIFAGGFDG